MPAVVLNGPPPRSAEYPTMQRLILFAVAALTIGSCHTEHAEHHEAARYLATTPLRADTQLTREYVAQIRAIQHIELRAMERGYLQETFVDEGRPVVRGRKMFQIMPLIYDAEVRKASAEAELARIEYNNTKMLADQDVVSANELAVAGAKVNKALAEVALATTHKTLTEVRAPFSGLMGRLHVRLGSLVDEGDLLTTLSDNRTVWVYFNVSESEYLHHQSQPASETNAEVRLVMANGVQFDQPGKVETIEADFNNETGNIAFRAAFPNPTGLLRHGETGKVLMTVPLRNALLIPQKATFDILDKKFVFVVDEKNTVRSRPIMVAAELPHLYAVQSGLTEHDRILVEGLRKVRDGVTVELDLRQPSEVLDHLEVVAE